VFATISAVACAFVWSAASFKSNPVQNAAPAPRKNDHTFLRLVGSNLNGSV